MKQILAVFGNRKIAIVREISKLYEEIIRDNIENILKISDNLKGEIVIPCKYKHIKTTGCARRGKRRGRKRAGGYRAGSRYAVRRNKTLFKLNGEKRYAVSGYKYEFGPLGCGVH